MGRSAWDRICDLVCLIFERPTAPLRVESGPRRRDRGPPMLVLPVHTVLVALIRLLAGHPMRRWVLFVGRQPRRLPFVELGAGSRADRQGRQGTMKGSPRFCSIIFSQKKGGRERIRSQGATLRKGEKHTVLFCQPCTRRWCRAP